MTGDEVRTRRLIERAVEGDERALSALLSEIRPRVVRWALVHTAAPDDAEDIAQQTLVRVSAKIAGFAGRSSFSTWVYAVTRSVAADWTRLRRRRAALLQAHPQPREDQGVRASAADLTELVERVREQLAHLPARQRELLDLVDLQGHAPAEAAELLSMNPATVRVHLLRARRTIRARILARYPAMVEDLT